MEKGAKCENEKRLSIIYVFFNNFLANIDDMRDYIC